MLATKILTMNRFELKTSQKLWLTQILYWKHNQLSYGIFSINLLLYFNVTHTIFIPKSLKLHIPTPPPEVYRRTSYISLLSTPPTSLRKDKLHIRSIHSKDTLCIPTYLHDYGKTSYIILLFTPPTRLRKDTLHISTNLPTSLWNNKLRSLTIYHCD